MPTINFNSSIFDTILSMVLVFALLSLLGSSIVELINNYYKRRQQLLYSTISRMFEDGINVNFGQLLYNHPSILSLRKDKDNLPQYIHHNTFAEAFIDKVCEYGTVFKYDQQTKQYASTNNANDIIGYFEQGVIKMKTTPLKLMLLNIVMKAKESTNTYDALKQQIVDLFNNQMDRTSGWYKAESRKLLRKISFVLVLFFNVNCFTLFETLYNNPELRSKMIPMAEQLVDSIQKTDKTVIAEKYKTAFLDSLNKAVLLQPKDTITKQILAKAIHINDSIINKEDERNKQALARTKDLLDSLKAMGLPIGWSYQCKPKCYYKNATLKYNTGCNNSNWFCKLANRFIAFWAVSYNNFWTILLYFMGLIISSFIVSAGSPFWFEVLTKMVNIRRAGIKPSNKTK